MSRKIEEGNQSDRFVYASRLTRLKLLQEISTYEKFSVPAFLFLGHEEVDKEGMGQTIKKAKDHFNCSPICRPCPVDEIFCPDLSFAGIFPTYIPDQKMDFETNVQRGVKKVLDSNEPNTEYYYDRHSSTIPSQTKERHVILMELIHNPTIHGTAYVYQDTIRSHYAIKPKWFTGETNLQCMSLCTDPTESISFAPNADKNYGLFVASKIRHPLKTIFDMTKTPADIEYLIDSDQRLWIVQARLISHAHLLLYQQMRGSNLQESNNVDDSALLNSCGTIRGRIYDMRNIHPYEIDGNRLKDMETILLICHRQPGLFSTKDLLNAIAREKISVRVLIDHQGKRGSDHLQYLVAEDPGVIFSFQSGNYESLGLADGAQVVLDSDGVHIKKAS